MWAVMKDIIGQLLENCALGPRLASFVCRLNATGHVMSSYAIWFQFGYELFVHFHETVCYTTTIAQGHYNASTIWPGVVYTDSE